MEFFFVNGDVRIENCDSLLNSLACGNLQNANFENISVINLSSNANGFFQYINNLNLKNISISINDNLYFENIKNLTVENATIDGKNIRTYMFNRITFGDFNNVEFILSSHTVKNKPIFNNVSNNYNKYFNKFNFKNCYFNMPAERVYIDGINGNFDNCIVEKINFGKLNDADFNVGIVGVPIQDQAPLQFNINQQLNNINITHYAWHNFAFSVSGSSNVVKFENRNAYDVSYDIVIDEGRAQNNELYNTYKFINDKGLLTMYINYGYRSGGASISYKNPEFHLGKYNNVIKFNCPNAELKFNTFDIYFNDVFRFTNFDVEDLKNLIQLFPSYDSSLWSEMSFVNSFNLHFNNNNYVTEEAGETKTKPIYNHIVTTTASGVQTHFTEFNQMDYHSLLNLRKYLVAVFPLILTS